MRNLRKTLEWFFIVEAQLTCIILHACQELQLVLFTKKQKSVKAFGKGIFLKTMEVVKAVWKSKNWEMKVYVDVFVAEIWLTLGKGTKY